MTDRVTFFRFARHHEVPDLEATGQWRCLGPLPGNHGHWSCLMQWCGEGEPPVSRDADLPPTTSPWV